MFFKKKEEPAEEKQGEQAREADPTASTAVPTNNPDGPALKQPGIIFTGLKSKLTSQELLERLSQDDQTKP